QTHRRSSPRSGHDVGTTSSILLLSNPLSFSPPTVAPVSCPMNPDPCSDLAAATGTSTCRDPQAETQEHKTHSPPDSPLPLGNSQTVITNVTAPRLAEHLSNRLGSLSGNPPNTANRPGTANRPASSRRCSNRPDSSASRSHVSAIIPSASFFNPVMPAKRQRNQIFLDVSEQTLAEERGPDGSAYFREYNKDSQTPGGSDEGRPVSSYRPETTSSSPLHRPDGHNFHKDTDLEAQITNRRVRNWKRTQGKTEFHLDGRLQTSYQYTVNFLTLGLIIIPSILFFIFTAPELWSNGSPAYPLTYAYLFALCVTSMLKATTSDPGILPRNLHLLEKEPVNDWDSAPSAKEIPIRKDEQNQYLAVTVKYCTTCRIWRPPRSSHCRKCDNCIEFSDHHCIWLNNCIGRRNYRYFFVFVITAVILGFYLSVLCCIHLSLQKQNGKRVSFATAIENRGVSFSLAIYGFIAALYPSALSGYHIYLVSRGQSTHEFLRDSVLPQTERQRPFATSVLSNFMAVLCRPKLVSYIRPRQYYEEGDRRFEDMGGFFDSLPQTSDRVELQVQPVPTPTQNDTPAEKPAAADVTTC
ncbi:Palmitoyltransferase erf2, partial [Neolecta irregularis DAH-3]